MAPPDWKQTFLENYKRMGVVTHAAEAAGVLARTVYRALDLDPSFKEEFEAARTFAVDELEVVARERALSHSDRLLIFLLKAERPEKYRDDMIQLNAGEIKAYIGWSPDGWDEEDDDDGADVPAPAVAD
jgi:hypothetical protein